ncbi:hypothetical protein [Corynebacterium glyciniphilum]|uniref:hypothetical protein n=1 Tax=Corynebacterium glyciniphilum TaxID=1404244 RepID=UPI00264F0281|nr:hypothetical protein [Corynebacterium glyciniphilum]MDN5682814.1 hypothetical protein [Corynebacterium glyciniphilum]MDN6706784.1 hypothetical protein [Corynebacterium glyciniphilum]
MKLTTRRLAAITVAATTATALVACGSDDAETATPAADTGVQEPAAIEGGALDQSEWLSTGETVDIASAGDTDGQYTLTVDNVTEDGNGTCADMVFTVDQADSDMAFNAAYDYLIDELGLAGAPAPEVFTVQDDTVATNPTSAPTDETFDTEALTVTYAFCVDDTEGADALAVEAGPDALAGADARGWLIDL